MADDKVRTTIGLGDHLYRTLLCGEYLVRHGLKQKENEALLNLFSNKFSNSSLQELSSY